MAPPERSPWGVFLATALFTGLREGELLGLRWEHTHLQAAPPFLAVRHGWYREIGFIEPKTDESVRDVPLPLTAWTALHTWRERGRQRWTRRRSVTSAAERVFPLAAQSYRDPMRRVIRAARLTLEPKLHQLRHQYASAMAARDVPAKVLQTWMGHSDIGMSLNYYAKGMDSAPVVEKFLGGFGERKVLRKVGVPQ